MSLHRSRSRIRLLAYACAAGGLSCAVLAQPARAETAFSLYLGQAVTDDSDIDLDLGAGTSLTFHDVSWDDDSFQNPLYYGARVSHFFDRAPNWGVALDFFHAKIYADEDDVVRVSGTRGGAAVDVREPLGNTFDTLNMSHGLNFLTLNAVYRWNPDADAGGSFLDRLRPYVGAWAGITIPHVEVSIGGDEEGEYQFGGPGFQAFAGVDCRLTERWSIFGEYKFSYADLDVDVPGGSLEAEATSHHVVFGVSFSF